MKEPWRERWVNPEIKEIIDDIKWMIMSLIGGGLLVGAINGIYALCEFLKTISIS